MSDHRPSASYALKEGNLYDYTLEMANGKVMPLSFLRGRIVVFATDCWCASSYYTKDVVAYMREERKRREIALLVANFLPRCGCHQAGDPTYHDTVFYPASHLSWSEYWPVYITALILHGTPIWDNPLCDFLECDKNEHCPNRAAVFSPLGKPWILANHQYMRLKTQVVRDTMYMYYKTNGSAQSHTR